MNVSSEHLNVQAEELKARIIENEKLQAEVYCIVQMYLYMCINCVTYVMYAAKLSSGKTFVVTRLLFTGKASVYLLSHKSHIPFTHKHTYGCKTFMDG